MLEDMEVEELGVDTAEVVQVEVVEGMVRIEVILLEVEDVAKVDVVLHKEEQLVMIDGHGQRARLIVMHLLLYHL